METKLVQLKTDFNNIISIRMKVKSIFDVLQSKIDKLQGLHAEFIKKSKMQMFIFGLDSFHFQSKLIDMENDDMKRLFLAISNRMYCEYFKLYKIIVEYILSHKNDKILDNIKVNNYPVYKDLEPYKEYKFEVIQDIHENILNLVSLLISTLNNKENEFLLHKNKQSIGLNIDNFITTFNYSINVMKEKIIMFITYIEFFHKLHTKYLKRFSNKIQLMYSHINHDIHFDDTKKSHNQKVSDNENNFITDIKYINTDNSTDSDYESTSSGNNFEINIKEDIIRSRTNSSISSNPNIEVNSPKFKLKINKEEKEKEHYQENDIIKVEEELDNIFSNIEISCDSIINNIQEEDKELKNDISENDFNIQLLEPPIEHFV